MASRLFLLFVCMVAICEGFPDNDHDDDDDDLDHTSTMKPHISSGFINISPDLFPNTTNNTGTDDYPNQHNGKPLFPGKETDLSNDKDDSSFFDKPISFNKPTSFDKSPPFDKPLLIGKVDIISTSSSKYNPFNMPSMYSSSSKTYIPFDKLSLSTSSVYNLEATLNPMEDKTNSIVPFGIHEFIKHDPIFPSINSMTSSSSYNVNSVTPYMSSEYVSKSINTNGFQGNYQQGSSLSNMVSSTSHFGQNFGNIPISYTIDDHKYSDSVTVSKIASYPNMFINTYGNNLSTVSPILNSYTSSIFPTASSDDSGYTSTSF